MPMPPDTSPTGEVYRWGTMTPLYGYKIVRLADVPLGTKRSPTWFGPPYRPISELITVLEPYATQLIQAGRSPLIAVVSPWDQARDRGQYDFAWHYAMVENSTQVVVVGLPSVDLSKIPKDQWQGPVTVQDFIKPASSRCDWCESRRCPGTCKRST